MKLNLNKDKECDCDIFGEAVWLEVIDLYKEEKPYHVEGWYGFSIYEPGEARTYDVLHFDTYIKLHGYIRSISYHY